MATITTPKGVLGRFAHLTVPDTKFNADGEYKANMTLPLKEVAKLLEKLEEQYDEALKAEASAKGKKTLKRADFPWEIDEDEGTVLMKFKLKAVIESKKRGRMERRVKLFDAKGKLIPNPKGLAIGGGTVAKIAFQPYFWFSPSVGFGLQLQMEACQILTLVEYSAGGDSDYGFGEEEGFVAEDTDSFGDYGDEDGEGSAPAAPKGADDDDF